MPKTIDGAAETKVKEERGWFLRNDTREARDIAMQVLEDIKRAVQGMKEMQRSDDASETRSKTDGE
jgi:hypothetical protein